jgi:hypothetical protein
MGLGPSAPRKFRVVKSWIYCATLVVVAGAPFATASSTRTSLSIVQIKPAVTVAGTHFRARERIRVTLTTGSLTRARLVRASSLGAFTANLGALPATFDRCTDDFAVLARGRSGDQAAVKYVPRGCPPAP